MRRKWVSLAAFLVLVTGGGLAIGYLTAPGDWYAQLAKPAFNPPAWVFGPAWATLYILIAVAGWRVWRRDRGGWAMTLWWVQLGLNFTWSAMFFSAPDRVGAGHRHRAPRRHPRLHGGGLAPRPVGRVAVYSLCRLGRFRVRAQRLDLEPQLGVQARFD